MRLPNRLHHLAGSAAPSAIPRVFSGALRTLLCREADAGPGEEQVRAPIPVRTERLYGDVPHRPPIPARRCDRAWCTELVENSLFSGAAQQELRVGQDAASPHCEHRSGSSMSTQPTLQGC